MEKIIARQLIKKTDTSEIMGYELLVQMRRRESLQFQRGQCGSERNDRLFD